MASGFFVTGTDTGVGKTRVACALLGAFAAAGRRAVGMKPVAAGSEQGRWEDVEALAQAGNVQAPRALRNPYAFEAAIAPHIAAELNGARIDIDTIARAYGDLASRADVVVVEGAGGFLIPLGARDTSADLACRLGLPVVLVVGMRLGCLNHALLTAEAIRARGLRLAGWVANCILPDMPHVDRNISTLEERLGCALLGVLPHHPGATPREQPSLSIAALVEVAA
jgi:dethiobiotin synthetase